MGIAALGLGLTREDYLEEMVKSNNLPSNTSKESDRFRRNTRREEHHVQQPSVVDSHTPTLPKMIELEALRDQVLQELKLGKASIQNSLRS